MTKLLIKYKILPNRSSYFEGGIIMKNIITYKIDRVANNSLYISVQNGEVTVKAPWYFTKNRIQEAVEEKRNWILEKVKE